jgi:enamine deaminase RidA (YjgF/YER057c/UK114 family)
MPREFLSPPEVGPTFGRYSKGVKTGDRIFLSGQVPWDADGNVVGPGDINAQAGQVMRNAQLVLESGAGSLTDLASTRVYTTNVQHRDVLAQSRTAHGLADTTATLAEVNSLVDPNFKFEMSGIAHLGGEQRVLAPETVHQTGWPYVHGVQVDDTVYLSGQIGLDPDGNLVGRGDPEAQADQAAQNLIRLLEAAGGSADDVVYTMLYVTNPAFIPAVRAARQKYGLTNCTSTLIVIPSLATADFLIEMEAIAVIGTEKTVIRPTDVHTVSPRYEHAVITGDTVYLAGQIALDPEGNLVGRGDAEAQARQLFNNMERVLASCGGTYDDIVATTTYMTNLQHRASVNKVRGELGINTPANASVVISALAQPEFLLEVEAIAVLGDR